MIDVVRTLCSGRCSLPGVQRVKNTQIVVCVYESIGFMFNIIKGIAMDWWWSCFDRFKLETI